MDLVAELRRNAWRSWERYVVTLFVLRPRNNTGARPIQILSRIPRVSDLTAPVEQMGLAIMSSPMAPPAKPCDGKVVLLILVSALDSTVFAIGARAPRGSPRRCSSVIAARPRVRPA
jgi:hypothetical protein